MTNHAYIIDAIRTPFGRYGGGLSSVRTDDLGAIPLKALMARNPGLDWGQVEDVYYGCANQAGEDNRNVARMSSLLAGLPEAVPGVTLNRLCGSGLDAVGSAARALKSGEQDLVVAGGVESMSRSPFVLPKATTAFSRNAMVEDTTIGWRFVNPLMNRLYGTDSMPETAENVAEDFGISRQDQDAFAFRSQQRAKTAMDAGLFEGEITPVTIPQRKAADRIIAKDEQLRPDTNPEGLAKLPTPFRANGSVTAGNASGVNDGAAALLMASDTGMKKYDLQPMARIVAMATAGVAPRIMGFGPALATRQVLAKTGLGIDDMAVIELNEAFASQALAVTRNLGLADDAAHVNPNGGAIALGHPLGASGARLVLTAARQLARTGGRYGLCTMCIGVGQGIALIIENLHQEDRT